MSDQIVRINIDPRDHTMTFDTFDGRTLARTPTGELERTIQRIATISGHPTDMTVAAINAIIAPPYTSLTQELEADAMKQRLLKRMSRLPLNDREIR